MNERFAPPGDTSVVRAERVLVIAPHFDDETLGCGGLLAQLVASGAEVRVLFLTDSAGGDEVVTGRAPYAEQRAREAQAALAVLGITEHRHAGLPDGRLAFEVDAAARAIREEILDLAPDLVLSVSPLEITRDHQAAFAALHRALSPIRPGDELHGVLEGARILLYEVNRPGLPDLLVDVGPQLEILTTAIRAYRSQLDLHNYLEAAIGGRRYRTLSLPPTVQAAEGFRQVAPADFASHGLSGMIRRLGGLPEIHEVRDGPPVSVVVRTRNRPELLPQALASLAAGRYRRVEIVLVNDGGEPPTVPDGFPLPVTRVDLPDNRGRAAAANAGVAAATGDYIAFLDDDDVAEPEHLETLAGMVSAAGVRVAYTDAAVVVYELDPETGWREHSRGLPYSRDFDPELLLVDNYIPFNAVLVNRELLAEAGPFDEALPFFEDWDLLIRLAGLAPFHHRRQVTCEYRHYRGAGHQILGEQASHQTDFVGIKARIVARYLDRLTPEVLSRVVTRLRDEAVLGDQDRNRLRDAHRTLEEAYHRLHGECETLRRFAAEQQATIERLQEQRDGSADKDEQLGALYAEVERLNSLIAAIQSTKAWRLHRAVERLRGRGPG